MPRFFRSSLAIVAGLVIGSAVNMGIVIFSSSIIPLPKGVDPTDIESLKAGIRLFGPQHFIMPWLAHALGTLTGAMVAVKIALQHKKRFSLTIGFFFLAGGIANAFMLPSPPWFIAVDLLGAYIPMSVLGYRILTSQSPQPSPALQQM